MVKEYIEREELRKYILEDVELCGEPDASLRPIAYGTILGLKGALNYVNTLPTADVVEVVRCKDCEFFISRDGISWCEEHSDGWGDHTVYVNDEDFCSDGIRKTD